MVTEHSMEINQIRENSLQAAQSIGILINKTLPLIDASVQLRPCGEIFERLMCLHVVAACAYGFNRKKAQEWLVQEDIAALTTLEKVFIYDGIGNIEQFKVQIEAMWALFWALGLISHLDFSESCNANFVSLLPNLKILQSASQIKTIVKCRSLYEIIGACDLAYCLHWGIQESKITGKILPNSIHPIVIVERRKALEWLISNDNWDNVSLDT